MAEQTLIIDFDLSDYSIIDELIINKINDKYWYQAVVKTFEGNDIIISRTNNNIKVKTDVGECGLNRFTSLQIYFMINRESLIQIYCLEIIPWKILLLTGFCNVKILHFKKCFMLFVCRQ
jgi:hypothetical protein